MSEKINTLTNNKKHCTECKNHCPIDSLGCKKGKELFGNEGTLAENRGEHDQKEHGYHQKYHHEGDFSHEKGHEKHHEHRGHHGRYDHEKSHGGHTHKNDDYLHIDTLYGLMRSCGHFLYHCTGRSTTQDKIISILSHKGSMTQKELQEILRIQPGSLSELLSKLEAKEMILRSKSEDDKRKTILTLTETGKIYADHQAEQNQDKQLFSVLTDEEQSTLEILLKKLLENWK